MKFSAPLVALVGLASMAFSAPAPAPKPAPVPDPVPHSHHMPAGAAEAAALAKRDDNWAWCGWNWGDGGAQFWVYSRGLWDDDGGQTFWEEVWNQCGEYRIIDWGFWYDRGSNDSDGNVYFMLSSGWPDKCVENAIYWASYNTGAISGVTCQWQS